MADYLQQLKKIFYMLASVSAPLDEDIILYILNGLPAQYNSFKTAIRAISHQISVIDLQELLLIEEHQLDSASVITTQENSYPASVLLAMQKDTKDEQSTGFRGRA